MPIKISREESRVLMPYVEFFLFTIERKVKLNGSHLIDDSMLSK